MLLLLVIKHLEHSRSPSGAEFEFKMQTTHDYFHVHICKTMRMTKIPSSGCVLTKLSVSISFQMNLDFSLDLIMQNYDINDVISLEKVLSEDQFT